MSENETLMDQAPVAEVIENKIPYEMLDNFLVKPLDSIKVKKEFKVPVAKDEKVDENGIKAKDFDEVKTEVREVDSDYRKGVVIKIPFSYKQSHELKEINVGDIIIFRDSPMSAINFDLLKDSKLVRYYEIVAVEKR